jgi:hypothetical protein
MASRVALAVGGFVVAVALASGSARGGGGATVPTVRCPVEAGMDGMTFPHWPARQRATVPASLAGEVAVYVGGLQRVVAPRSWRCKVQEAVDGSDVINVEPRRGAARLSVSSWTIPACVGCMFSAVCAYFPREAKAVSVGLPCESKATGQRLKRLSRTLVDVRSTDGSSFALVYFEPRGDNPRAAGVTCVHARRICSAVLADWRAARG